MKKILNKSIFVWIIWSSNQVNLWTLDQLLAKHFIEMENWFSVAPPE